MSQNPAPDDNRAPDTITPSNPSSAGEWGVPPQGSPQPTGDSSRKLKIGVAVWLAIAVAIFATIILFAVLG